MKFFLILIKLFIYTKCSDFYLIMNEPFKTDYERSSLGFENCQIYDENSFYYRGRPTNIKDIIKSTDINNYGDYKYVYIPDKQYLSNITLFPKPTIFFTNEYIYNSSDYKEYCIITIGYNLENYKKILYYMIAGKGFSKYSELHFILMVASFVTIFIILVSLLCRIVCLFFKFQRFDSSNCCRMLKIILGSVIISITGVSIYYFRLTHLIYCIYKSFILATLFFLIDGYKIIDFEQRRYTFSYVFIICLLYYSTSTLLFIYIVYFIPSINNFYLFAFKNVIEHVILLLLIIKAFREKFIPLYRQYKIDEGIKRINYITCKIKIIAHLKVLIFSLFYGISFILLSFIEIIYNLGMYCDIFYYNYFFNIFLEIIFVSIFVAIFFPSQMSVFYYINPHYDRIFSVNLKNVQNPISILTREILKNKVEKKSPVVFVNPFFNNENPTKNSYIGFVENKIIN